MTRFTQVLNEAIREFITRGFTSAEQLDDWMARVRAAAEGELISERRMQHMMQERLGAIYRRLVQRGEILRKHPGVSRFTLDRIAPHLRAELDRRIMASANLIKLNRTSAIEKTLQRFAGWATSIPQGGTEIAQQRETVAAVKKGVAGLPFVERRVLIDQGQKLASAINETLANDAGALAAVWEHHYSLHPREDHQERNGKVFLIRNSWAHKAGLVKPNDDGYYDDIEKPGEYVFCRCTARYVYNLRSLPADMLTAKGKAKLEEIRNNRNAA
ncbi:MAG: hypothetical protein KGL39_35020 [Patescibacteria group bacterium]|nr:hypothetical protein [Patescibacteria group bacterium]